MYENWIMQAKIALVSPSITGWVKKYEKYAAHVPM